MSDREATVAVVAACVLWGISFPLSKAALSDLTPAHLVLLRFALAALPLVGLLVREGARPPSGDLPILVVTGILCVPVTYLLQFAGLARTSVTSASLLVATATPLLAVAGGLVCGERLGSVGWLAVVLSTAGAALMIGIPGDGRTWLGDALVFASIVLSVVWILLGKGLAIRHGPGIATAWILLIGTVVLVPVVAIAEGPPPLALPVSTWLCVLALATGSTFGAFVLWNRGVRGIETGRAGVYLNLEPVVGAGAGILVFGDALTAPIVFGGIAVLVGGALASRPRPPFTTRDLAPDRRIVGRPASDAESA